MPNIPPRHQDASDRIERRREVAVAEQRLQDPVGCENHREGTGAGTATRGCRRGSRSRRTVDCASRRTGRSARCPAGQPRAQPGEHPVRTIDPDQIDAGSRQRERDAAGAAAELEHAAVRRRRQSAARTARRGGRASARSPSRRTARTRPIPATLHGTPRTERAAAAMACCGHGVMLSHSQGRLSAAQALQRSAFSAAVLSCRPHPVAATIRTMNRRATCAGAAAGRAAPLPGDSAAGSVGRMERAVPRRSGAPDSGAGARATTRDCRSTTRRV